MKKLKILRLVKTKPACFDSKSTYNVIECGKDRYTLSNCREIDGHDDSLPYAAKLCLNGKPVCSCFNDGWGGMTELKPLDIASRAILSSMRIKLKQYKWSCGKTEFPFDLEFVADTLACGTLEGK